MLNIPSPPPVRRSQRAQVIAVWLPPLISAALIFYASSLPGSVFPSSPFYSADKVLHLGAYTMLGYLVARALGYHGHAGRTLVVLACSLCFLYGVSDEVHQAFVPGRNPSFMDLGADVLGSSLGTFTYTRKR